MKMTTKTREQIAADFAAVFKSIEPVRKAPVLTLADCLEPYRKEVLKQRRRGLAWKQIALGMRDPRIGEKVSEKLLRRLFGEKPAATPARKRLFLDPVTNQPITVPPPAPAASPSAPPRRRLILDPATGKPVPPPAA